jgi:type II secretion system protein J
MRYGRTRLFALLGDFSPAGKLGFTLVEMLVAFSILSFIAGSIYLVFSTAISVWNRDEVNMQVYQDGRLAVSTMGREIGSCFIPESSGDEGIPFTGDESSLKFVTISSLDARAVLRGARLIEVCYYLEHDENTLVLLGEKKTLVGPAADERHILAENVTSLKFCYFDGEDWMDSWQGEEGLPQAVKITLGLKQSDETAHFRTNICMRAGGTTVVPNEEEE